MTDAAYLDPINLRDLLDSDPPEEEWAVEPIAPTGRSTFIHAPHGQGKSLLMLDIAAGVASGRDVLNYPTRPPQHVVYIDLEMGPDDLYDRLSDLAYRTTTPEFTVLEKHLHYFQGIDLPPLDTPQGGETLEQLIDDHLGQVLVLDTLGRVTKGEENSNDTYRLLDQHTMRRLRRRQLTTIALDHTGRDTTRGARGASAKGDIVDIQWALTITGTRLQLKRTKGRQRWVPPFVIIDRQTTNDRVRHVAHSLPADADTLATIDALDELKVPLDATVKHALQALRDAGRGRRSQTVQAALRLRRVKQKPDPK